MSYLHIPFSFVKFKHFHVVLFLLGFRLLDNKNITNFARLPLRRNNRDRFVLLLFFLRVVVIVDAQNFGVTILRLPSMNGNSAACSFYY